MRIPLPTSWGEVGARSAPGEGRGRGRPFGGPDAFGNALGNSIVGAMNSPSGDAEQQGSGAGQPAASPYEQARNQGMSVEGALAYAAEQTPAGAAGYEEYAGDPDATQFDPIEVTGQRVAPLSGLDLLDQRTWNTISALSQSYSNSAARSADIQRRQDVLGAREINRVNAYNNAVARGMTAAYGNEHASGIDFGLKDVYARTHPCGARTHEEPKVETPASAPRHDDVPHSERKATFLPVTSVPANGTRWLDLAYIAAVAGLEEQRGRFSPKVQRYDFWGAPVREARNSYL